MEWEPIKPYEMKCELAGVSELEALKLVWADYREYFGPEMTKNIQDRFNREWSIETGQIEGAYNLDRGLTETLVEHGITADLISHQANGKSPEQVASILRDQVDAIEGLFEFVKGGSPLTTSYIRQLHQQLMLSEPTYTVFTPDRIPVQKPLAKGKYKLEPNSPLRPDGITHPYCPPEQVDGEMERLVEIYHEQLALPIEIQAAWLHHAFTQIHPFQDGNGRVARALATLVLIKGGLLPLLVFRDDRPIYISSLEQADNGDLWEFIQFVRRSERSSVLRLSNSLTNTTQMSAQSSQSVDEILADIEMDFVVQDNIARKEWRIDQRIEGLYYRTQRELEELAKSVLGRLSRNPNIGSNVGTDEPPSTVLAGDLKLNVWKSLRVFLTDGRVFSLYFYFGLPDRFRGLAVVSALSVGAGKQEQLGDYFLINYKELEDELNRRFSMWLHKRITEGLQQWRVRLKDKS